MRAKWEGAQKERQDVSERMDVVSLKNNCRKQDIPEYRKRFLKWESPALLFLLYLLSTCISYSFLLFPLLSDLIILYSMVFTPSPNDSQIHDLHTQLCVLFLNDEWSSLKENWLSFSSNYLLSIALEWFFVSTSPLHSGIYFDLGVHGSCTCGHTHCGLCIQFLDVSPPPEWTLSHYFLLHNDPRASGGGGVT